MSFTVAAGCKDVQLTLVSYKAPAATYSEATASQQERYRWVTLPYQAGANSVSVELPNCFFQVDFVYGESMEHLSGDTSGSYTKQDRLITGLNGGSGTCSESSTTTTPPAETPPPATTPPPAETTPPAPTTAPVQNTAAPVAPAPPASIAVLKLERVGPTGDFVAGPVSAKVGDTVYYQIVVTNTGPAVSVSLADLGCSGLTPTGPQGLDSGKSISFTCSHTVVAADGASWMNTATATATAANGIPVTASSSVVANITATGVLGTTATIKHTAKAKPAKVKKVTKRAKPAHAQVRAASFTG